MNAPGCGTDATDFLANVFDRNIYDATATENLAVGLFDKRAHPWPFQALRDQDTHFSCALFEFNTPATVAPNHFQRSKERWTGAIGVVLDDVGEVKDGVLIKTPPVQPTAIIETKPGSFQWVYLFNRIERDPRLVETIQRSAIAGGLCDPAAGGITRITRLPGSLPAGKKHRAELIWADWTRRFNPDAIIEKAFQVARIEAPAVLEYAAPNLSDDTSEQGKCALDAACRKIRSAGGDTGSSTINAQAFFIGRNVGAGLISLADAEAATISAAYERHPADGVRQARNGLDAGILKPLDRVSLPKAAELPSGRKGDLLEALEGATPATALPIALAVAQKMSWRVPVSQTIDGIERILREHLPDGLVTDAEFWAIKGRLQWAQGERKKEALRDTRLPNAAHLRHNVEETPSLEALAAFEPGVTVLRGPMGIGKTQRGGKPFVDGARGVNAQPLAVCHRISLTTELSSRLGLPNYQNALKAEMRAKGAAYCLPSLTKADAMTAIKNPEAVFIDEISQVLRFAAQYNKLGGATRAKEVLERLTQLVTKAKYVLVADATIDERCISFLEACRPDEKFRVVDVVPQRINKTATVFDSRADVAQAVLCELERGGKVWLACESAKATTVMAQLFEQRGHKTLAITSATKGLKDQAAFLADAENESRKYDVVVASPAISSGLSIEHRDREHFTLGGFIGSGHSVCPDDAAQMISRVRYLRRFVIGLETNTQIGGQTLTAIRDGERGLAEVRNAEFGWTNYDSFCARVVADDRNARADFAAGLWWWLENAGWALEHGVGNPEKTIIQADIKILSKAAKYARIADLRAAEPMTSFDFDMMTSGQLSEAEQIQADAHRLHRDMGTISPSTAEVEFWDEGRGRAKIRRFAAMSACKDSFWALPDDRTDVALRRLYGNLFDGIDPFEMMSTAGVGLIVDRIMGKPEVFAAAGIVGDKYRARYHKKTGELAIVKRPAKVGVEVSAMFARAGLEVSPKRVRVSKKSVQLCPHSLKQEGTTGQNPTREHVYNVCPDSIAFMAKLLARLDGFDLNAVVDAERRKTAPDPAELHWQRAGRRAQKRREAYQSTMAEKEWRDTIRHDGSVGHGAEVPKPIPAPEIHRTLAPRPERDVIWIPEPEQITARLSCPVSHYRVEPDGPRLVTAEVGEVFANWYGLDERDPDAWA